MADCGNPPAASSSRQPWTWLATGGRGADGATPASNQALWLWGSRDGFDWTLLGPGEAPSYQDADRLRDPAFWFTTVRGVTTMWVAYTRLASAVAGAYYGGTEFAIAKTTDLRTFTRTALVSTTVAEDETATVPSTFFNYGPEFATFQLNATYAASESTDVLKVFALPFDLAAHSAVSIPTADGPDVVTTGAAVASGATLVPLEHPVVPRPGSPWRTGSFATVTTPDACTYPAYSSVSYRGSTYYCLGSPATGETPGQNSSPWFRRTATWGPQPFRDPQSGRFYIFQTINLRDIYAYRCVNPPTFTAFDQGTAVIRAGADGFPETIYATFVFFDSRTATYHLWANSVSGGHGGTSPVNWHATSKALLSGWKLESADVFARAGVSLEGPMVVFDGARYRLYGDYFGGDPGHGGVFVATSANLTQWSTPRAITFDGGHPQSPTTTWMREGNCRPIGIPGSSDYDARAWGLLRRRTS